MYVCISSTISDWLSKIKSQPSLTVSPVSDSQAAACCYKLVFM